MDTEEMLEIRRAQALGRPETDEGPYYHETWWESYKGSVKGKLGGSLLGAVIGAVVGGVVALALIHTLPIALAVIAGFSASGMLYGMHEFSEVGKVTGAVAAAQEKNEIRMKAFEQGKFAEIKREIGDIKSMLAGKSVASINTANAAPDTDAQDPINYRTTHCDDQHCAPENRKWVYWKVALIGLIIGMAAGSLLAYGALAAGILGELGGANVISASGVYAASVISTGLFGASFGINRDLFRQLFDKTDLWFKGIVRNGHARQQQISASAEMETPREVTTIVCQTPVAYPISETYHRDRVLAAAEKALQNFDHTRATPQ